MGHKLIFSHLPDMAKAVLVSQPRKFVESSFWTQRSSNGYVFIGLVINKHIMAYNTPEKSYGNTLIFGLSQDMADAIRVFRYHNSAQIVRRYFVLDAKE